MRIFYILLLFTSSANAQSLVITPTFESGVLDVPVVQYAPKLAAKASLKLDFETRTFEVQRFESFDCSVKRTYFSPFPTLENYNPCDFIGGLYE